jgi:RNAse (barnase) inhibitor barstar
MPIVPRADLPVLTIDGAAFDDFEGFQRAFSALLSNYTWRGNLDAFNDILRGGFGTPEEPWVLRWVNADTSRRVLGHDATVRHLEEIVRTCHPSNVVRLQERIARARRAEGPTLFDEIIEILRGHGPGGAEEEDGVVLELR